MNHDHRDHTNHSPGHGAQTTVEYPRAAGMVTDPVCGMTVDPETAAGSATHDGTTYHFCSRHCLTKFEADPERYAGPAPKSDVRSCCGGAEAASPRQLPPKPTTEAVKYTCPMHPEVVRDGPGTCPKCGMALEPMIPQAGEEDDSELRDMTRRFRLATALTLPVFVLAMAPMIPAVKFPHWLTEAANWIGLALATPVVFWAGWPFFVRAWQALAHRTANMFTLIALGTGCEFAACGVRMGKSAWGGDHGQRNGRMGEMGRSGVRGWRYGVCRS